MSGDCGHSFANDHEAVRFIGQLADQKPESGLSPLVWGSSAQPTVRRSLPKIIDA
jgi:hypothetical protein